MNPLIGKKITAIWLANDKTAIKFDIEGGEPIIAHCDADCCSYTWIEEIEGATLVIGQLVIDARNLQLNTPDFEANGEYIQFYGFQIDTPAGSCILDYRNSSNGYYGGWLVWPGSRYYGGVWGQNVSKEEWRKVT